MDIFNILNNDISGLSEEEKKFADDFNRNVREKIIEELVEYEINELIKYLKEDKEVFKEKVSDIFIYGKKGYKDMPTKTLIDIYINKMNEGDFINLIESISNI